MLDGLQICENEPNFDSNIIYTQHTGVEKRQQQERPKDGRFFLFHKWCKKRGDPALASSELYIQEQGVRQLRLTAPHRTRSKRKRKNEKNKTKNGVVSRQ